MGRALWSIFQVKEMMAGQHLSFHRFFQIESQFSSKESVHVFWTLMSFLTLWSLRWIKWFSLMVWRYDAGSVASNLSMSKGKRGGQVRKLWRLYFAGCIYVLLQLNVLFARVLVVRTVDVEGPC